jgi:hypothetical protein
MPRPLKTLDPEQPARPRLLRAARRLHYTAASMTILEKNRSRILPKIHWIHKTITADNGAQQKCHQSDGISFY